MRNEIQIAGPVMSPAVDAVTVKMPAPITTDTPNTQRCHQLKSLRSWVSGSSVSAIDCSIDLVRQRSAMDPDSTEYGGQMGGEKHPGTRRSDRRQHRRIVRGAGAVRLLRPGHGVRARRTAGHTQQPHRRPAGPPRSPADGPRRAGIRRVVPRSARRHGGRRRSHPGEPAGLHPLRRGRSRAGHRAYAARPVHRLRAQPPAAGMADPAPGMRHRQRRDPASLGGPTTLRRRRATGHRGVAGQRRRRARLRRRRPGRRRGRPRHPAAGVAGAVGISASAREDGRRGHRLCVAPASAARRRDP